MCAPAIPAGVSLAISLAMTAASTAMTMYAQNEQQKTQERQAKASAKMQAELAENDAAVKRQQAQMEQAKGEELRNRQQRAAAKQQGEMASMLGASGFALDSGSSLSLLSDNAEEAQHESNLITQDANMASWQHLVGANNAENQKSMYDYQYRNAGSGRTYSMLQMGGTLLGGISEANNSIKQYNKRKM